MIVKATVLCVFLGLFSLGLYDVLTNFEANNCEMTYMFETPEYLKIELNQNVTSQFPRYNLYFYGEGQYASNAKRSKFRLTGIPVLFIPGNAGSYRQVRSLGSVALRMANSLRTKFQFNFFSVDLNEELSGIYGPVLMDQSKFTYECIKKILDLYSSMSKNRPNSVFLVGHSMGGLIARALYTLPDFDRTLVNSILTQATPHQMPLIAIDPVIVDFYSKVNGQWSDELPGFPGNVFIVSTGGGYRDILVRNGLASLCKIGDPSLRLFASTMSIPKAWVSTDHLAHVWCKQVVMATVRAMFDCVDRNTQQISEDRTVCRKAFLYHYQVNLGPKFLESPASDSKPLLVKEEREWSTSKDHLWSYEAKQVAAEFYHSFEIDENVSTDRALLAISNLEDRSWFGGCTTPAGAKKCKHIKPFDDKTELLPPTESKFKAIHLDGRRLSDFTHSVVHVPKTKQPVKVLVDIYKVADRHIVFQMPHLVRFLKNSVTAFDSGVTIPLSSSERGIFYNLTMEGLESPFQAYIFEVMPMKCSKVNSDVPFTSLMKLHVPWSHEHTYSTFQLGQKGQLSLKLQSGKPLDFIEDVQLHLYLDRTCAYRISVRLSWSELFGQFIRFYGLYVPSFFVIQVLMSMSWQLKKLTSEGVVPKFSVSHSLWALPFRVVPFAMMLRMLISQISNTEDGNRILKAIGLPTDDTVTLKDQDIWHPLIPLLLYVMAFSFMTFYSRAIEAIIAVLSAFSAFACKRICSGQRTNAVLRWVQYFVLISGAAASFWLCGTLGLIVCLLTHIDKTVVYHTKARLFEKDGAVEKDSRVDKERILHLNASNLCFSLSLLFALTLILNSIPFIVWCKSISRENFGLHLDPSVNIGVIACISSLILVSRGHTLGVNILTSNLSKVAYASSVLMVIYCLVSVYRISYFVLAFLILLAVSTRNSTGLELQKDKVL